MLAQAGFANLRSTTDPRTTLGLVDEFEPDLVLLDLHMPGIDGFAILNLLRERLGDMFLPVLVLTADVTSPTKERALSLGAKDFLTKPFDRTEALLRIRNLLETRALYEQLREQNLTLEAKVRDRTEALEAAHAQILARLSQAAEFRDDETGQHTRRVGELSARVGTVLGMSASEVAMLRQAAPLHDVGKIGIPDEILLKPGRLTLEEFAIMRTHTTIGAALLARSGSSLLQMAEQIALTHHERWDGSGYPRALAGDMIPLPGRIVAVVDVFDALTSTRSYKAAWSLADARAELVRQRGVQFDPAVVDTFLAVLNEIL
jgi:putative two-component system response regulator